MDNNEQEELPLEEVKLDLDKIRDNIPRYSSAKLCEVIVSARYFSMDQQIIVMCMQELAARRMAGDNFQFELYIEESQAKLPPLNFSIPDLRTALTQMIKANQK
jgi:hypothetical protein